ncbi:unnamed protein product, partial [Mesorhabditis belari]|uniref:Uncharacterized protein n=1 Tax=Mesorhabditis belari TaxID=2138241 RepID=A0AAF3ETZ7_9BILA
MDDRVTAQPAIIKNDLENLESKYGYALLGLDGTIHSETQETINVEGSVIESLTGELKEKTRAHRVTSIGATPMAEAGRHNSQGNRSRERSETNAEDTGIYYPERWVQIV